MRIPFSHIDDEEYTQATYRGEPFTGTAFDLHNGRVVEECDFVAGRRHGVHREFYTDGPLRCVAEFRDGMAHGPDLSFFTSGKSRRRAVYDRGVLLEAVEYGEQGQKVLEYTAASGIEQEWRLDGSLRKVTLYVPETSGGVRAPLEERYFDAHGLPTITHTANGWALASGGDQ